VKAGDAFEILARNVLGESVHATPVPVADQLLIRTASRLQGFRESTSIRR